MSTRRDTELTTPQQMALFNELRGLFRHVPFTASDFAILAPSVAHTLNRDKPEEALPLLWDVLDQQEPSKYLDALLALLGMSGNDELNVLDRKSALNSDVHPRTIARHADTALKSLVAYLDREYVIEAAMAFVSFFTIDGEVDLLLAFSSTIVEMESPVVTINGEVHDLPVAPTPSFSDQHKMIVQGQMKLEIDWRGPLFPIYEIDTPSREKWVTSVAQTYMSLRVWPQA